MDFYTSCDTMGNKVFLREVVDGQLVKRVIEHKPSLYIKTNDAANADAKSMFDEPLERIDFEDSKQMKTFIEEYKDISGFSVYGSDSIMNQFMSQKYPGELKYEESMIRVGVLDIETFSGSFDAEGNVLEGPFPDPEIAEFPISMMTLHCSHDNTYHVWGLETCQGRKIGTYVHDPAHGRVGKLNVQYYGFDNEHTMLIHFVNFWEKAELHAWSGWYIEGFDNPYLTNRIEKICGEPAKKKLSPWGIVKTKKTNNDWGQETTQYDFVGCQMLDYQALFKKHGFISPDNWKLETVAEMTLGEGKIDYSEEGSINTLYVRNYQKSVVYNVIDVDLIVQMNRKKKFFELTFILAYITKSNYRDTLATVRPWSALSFSMLHDQGIMPKIKGIYQGDVSFGGGFVRDVKPGRYRWVVSGDFNSLYPHIMQMYNMGTETIIEPEDLPHDVRGIASFTLDDLVNKKVDLSPLTKHGICMTPNRQFFRKEKRSMYNVRTRLIYDTRKQVKDDMLGFEQQLVDLKAKHGKDCVDEHIVAIMEKLSTQISFNNVHQHSLKILMNSLFGFISNIYARDFFDVRIAEGITTGGQLGILWISRKLDEYLNKVMGLGEVEYRVHHTARPASTRLEVMKGHNFAIYMDTDSVYLDMSMLVDKFFTIEQQEADPEKVINFLDQLFKMKIEPYINESCQELADYMNADNRLFMKRENISPAAIFVAPKKYQMTVADSEGVRYFPNMKHKIVGLDAIRASFPKFCRSWMKEAYLIALNGTEEKLQSFIAAKKIDFMKTPIDKIASVISVSNLFKYSDPDTVYIKGATKQAKASLWHNKLLDKFNITNVAKINSGDKILMVGLNEPNPYQIDTIAFKGKLPTEFGLHKYVDYSSNWDKNFISPMNNLLRTIKWNTEKQATVLDWFD
jgi:DNA polymerase elongation subunit (family B)